MLLSCGFRVDGADRPDCEHVLASFRALRENEKIAPEKDGLGEYRTAHLTLDRYDAMTSVIKATRSYTTCLDIPAAADARRHNGD